MNKIKVLREHQTYEVFNMDAYEAVYFESKPTEQDLIDICIREQWGFKEINALKQYIKDNIQVKKIKIYYRDDWVEPNPMPKRPRGTVRCSHCSGCGFKMDDSYSSFGCPWCNGKGYVEKTEPHHNKGWTERDQ